jgi:hypothetical protein
MIRLIAVAGFALAVASSAEAMTPAPIHQPDGVITQVAYACGPVSAWPEPPSAIPAGPSEGVHDGTEAFALGTIERAIYTEAAARIAGLMSGFRSELINQRSRRRVQIVRWMIPAIVINENHHPLRQSFLGKHRLVWMIRID